MGSPRWQQTASTVINLRHVICWSVQDGIAKVMMFNNESYLRVDAAGFESAMQTFLDTVVSGSSLRFNDAANSQYVALLFEDF